MNNITYRARTVTRLPLPSSEQKNPLAGMSRAQVIAACQAPISVVSGNSRTMTGETFLNGVTLSLVVFSKDFKRCDPITALNAQFHNTRGSEAVRTATYLSTQYFKTGAIPNFEYMFKIIDAKTGLRMAGDYPEFEEAVEVEQDSDVPDYLARKAKTWVAPKGIAAFLKIFLVDQITGKPEQVGYASILDRDQEWVDKAIELEAGGFHVQAGVILQAKVKTWADTSGDSLEADLAEREDQAVTNEISELFQAVAEA